MKKINLLFVFSIICCICFFSWSCKDKDNPVVNEPDKDYQVLSIYSVNDFHGAIKEKASRVGKYLQDNKSANEQNTLVLSAGDMFQGTGLSNLHHGKDMVNIMNMMKFDAMTIGNHEFDWGLETILDYFDGNPENGEADFPLLGCNVIDKRTNKIPANMDSYTIVKRGDLKIAIIGYIGVGLENSIANNMVKNYEFKNPTPIINDIASTVRQKEGVDIVIASGHDASSSTNRDLANLEGSGRVDAIINGHTHTKSTGSIKRISDGILVPYVQAGSSGEYVGKIELKFNHKTKSVMSSKAETHLITDLAKESAEIQTYVDKLVEDTASVFERVIGTAGRDLNQFSGATWACNAMQSYVKENYEFCDVAFTNIGGIRENAFPIQENEVITVDRIYQLMPFDNTIKLVELKGKVLRALLQNLGELTYSSSTVKMEGLNIYINGQMINDDTYYHVACVDYIFDKESYPFLKGENIIATGVLFRDLLIENIEAATSNGLKCF